MKRALIFTPLEIYAKSITDAFGILFLTGLTVLVFFAVFMLSIAGSEALEEELKPQAQEAQQALSEEKKPVLVTMDFEDADIRDVIKVITMASGMNMVIGEDVQAKVTISLEDVPWEKALDVILRTHSFTYKREKNLIRIMTFEKVKQEERDIPMTTKIIYLNFANVGQLKSTLSKMLSDRGSIEVDARTNSMLITDIPAKLEEVEKIARQLDTRTPQVLIEAMLVDVKLTEDDELGINWNIVQVDRGDDYRSKTIDTARSGYTTTYNYIEQPTTMNDLNTAIRFGWLERLGAFRIDGLIQVWAQEAKANILASPKIVTLDNQTAKIEIKSQVAYTQVTQSEGGGSSTSTQFKDVITGLEVTPHITKEGFISMNVKPKQEFIEGTVGGEPAIGSRSAETNVLVKDGETIVIGGLRKVEDNVTITKVPILGDIPFIGNLFRKKDVQKINTELVMFVTPHIIIHPELTEEEIDRYEMLDDAREKFLRKQEKERKKSLRRRRKQAKLVEPEITQDLAFPEEEIIEPVKKPTLPAAKLIEPEITEAIAFPEEEMLEEEITEELELPPLPEIKEEDEGYIYVW